MNRCVRRCKSRPCWQFLLPDGKPIFSLQKEGSRMKWRIFGMLALTAAVIPVAVAQQYVYPAKGQSPQQQQSDEAACYTWAVQQSGVDPAKPPAQQAQQQQQGATQQQQAAFAKARAACLEGRGYSVK